VGWACECGVKLAFNEDLAECASCTKRYAKRFDDVVEPEE